MSAATLRRAAAIVREQGWTQGTYEDGGRVCMEGAICAALGGRTPSLLPLTAVPVWSMSMDAVRRALRGRSAIDWNDAPERTADEVVAALEAAAARLELAG